MVGKIIRDFMAHCKCVGPNKISSDNKVELNVFCYAYDNEGDTFGLMLFRLLIILLAQELLLI